MYSRKYGQKYINTIIKSLLEIKNSFRIRKLIFVGPCQDDDIWRWRLDGLEAQNFIFYECIKWIQNRRVRCVEDVVGSKAAGEYIILWWDFNMDTIQTQFERRGFEHVALISATVMDPPATLRWATFTLYK